MLRDVGQPQLIGSSAGQLAIDQIGGDLIGLGQAPPCGEAKIVSIAVSSRG